MAARRGAPSRKVDQKYFFFPKSLAPAKGGAPARRGAPSRKVDQKYFFFPSRWHQQREAHLPAREGAPGKKAFCFFFPQVASKGRRCRTCKKRLSRWHQQGRPKGDPKKPSRRTVFFAKVVSLIYPLNSAQPLKIS